MAQPSFYPEWSLEDVNLPNTGQSNKQRPKESLRLTGWDQGQLLTAEEWNWQFKNIYDWIYHFNNDYLLNATSNGTPATITLRNSVGGTNFSQEVGLFQTSTNLSSYSFYNTSNQKVGSVKYDFSNSILTFENNLGSQSLSLSNTYIGMTNPRSLSTQGVDGADLTRKDYVDGLFNIVSSSLQTLSDNLIGVPIPWPTSTLPAGYLELAGQAFNTATYPKLALKYPSGVLPDMRGEFIRGWDNSRGIDSGRSLLSWQDGTVENHNHVTTVLLNNALQTGTDTGQGLLAQYTSPPPAGYGNNTATGGTPDSETETKPRNVAFWYITKAL